MADQFIEYSETTDLYMEILQEAQRVEDKKLVEMIRRRLGQLRQPIYTSPDGCQIIVFPKSFLPPDSSEAETRFWPKQKYSEIAILLAFYLLVLSGHTLF